jgi:alanine racemase
MAGRHSSLPALTRAQIDLSALAANYRELRRVADPQAGMMAVVKANGYGHGAVEVSRVALANGATWLAVARASEAVALRAAGIAAPILLFGHCLLEYSPYLWENGIRASVSDLETARQLSGVAQQHKCTLKVHAKFDTGMGRLGIPADTLMVAGKTKTGISRAANTLLEIARLPGLDVEGLYTHFANADAGDKGHARGQLMLFLEILEELERHGFQAPMRHAANSAATIELPDSHLDMVRPGISQYGLWPSEEVDRSRITLIPAMTLKSTVIQVKDVPAGFKISYGSTYTTPAPTRIATVPLGYADGYSRRLSSRGIMLVHGQRAPVVGRVCMDLTMIDVGAIPDVAAGDEVVAMGRQQGDEVSADEVARVLGTINYEVVSALTSRVERVYTT